MKSGKPLLIGVISDTHGPAAPEAIEALRGSEHIIHPSPTLGPEILEKLSTIAPVTPVRGNIDKVSVSEAVLKPNALELGGSSIYVLHDLAQLDLKPKAAGFAVVVSRPQSRPQAGNAGGVLLSQPRSGARDDFSLP